MGISGGVLQEARVMRVGDFEVRLINDGECRVDGGAMFGARPKTIWSRLVTSDAHNRVPLAINCLLIETPHKRILVDVGIGAGTPSEFRDLHGLTGVKGMRGRNRSFRPGNGAMPSTRTNSQRADITKRR
jgi:hypothetical protein